MSTCVDAQLELHDLLQRAGPARRGRLPAGVRRFDVREIRRAAYRARPDKPVVIELLLTWRLAVARQGDPELSLDRFLREQSELLNPCSAILAGSGGGMAGGF